MHWREQVAGNLPVRAGESFQVWRVPRAVAGFGILCLRCMRLSCHPGDVANLYCAACAHFHLDDSPRLPASAELIKAAIVEHLAAVFTGGQSTAGADELVNLAGGIKLTLRELVQAAQLLDQAKITSATLAAIRREDPVNLAAIMSLGARTARTGAPDADPRLPAVNPAAGRGDAVTGLDTENRQ